MILTAYKSHRLNGQDCGVLIGHVAMFIISLKSPLHASVSECKTTVSLFLAGHRPCQRCHTRDDH